MQIEIPFADDPRSERPLSVSELTAQIKETLEDSFPAVAVTGEISDLARPRSGHVYLTLKDESAQIRAVIWRTTAARVAFDLQDGLEVVCRGQIDVYAPRGSYQLMIRSIDPLGIGALQLAFRQLQARLSAEGLFDAEHKQSLPVFPRRIAFVTSPTGAAIRDFLEVLRRRWPGADVMVIPTPVQGEGAAVKIARGIEVANQLVPRPDVLVVGRGGGSVEDLWCFNEEPVVRAIFASQIPVVSAVGHEIDVTLADLVADVRALTPSEAAERVVPSEDEMRVRLRGYQELLMRSLHRRATDARTRLNALAERRALSHPFDRVRELARRVDELELRCHRAVRQRWVREQEKSQALAGQLETLSPIGVLARGYSLTTLEGNGALVIDADTVQPGELIRTRLARGQLVSCVERSSEE